MKKKIIVAVSDFPPLIMNNRGRHSGFEIELWQKIAEEVGLNYRIEEHDFHDLISLLEKKKVDVALSGITINKYREEKMDFSHPTLDSGLLILVDKNRNKIRIWDNIKYLFREGHNMMTEILLAVLAFTVLIGHLLWFLERNHGTFNQSYFPGIFESFWLVVCSMSTVGFGDFVPHTWPGRIVTTIITVAGVAIFGILIAQVTAFLAIRKMKGDINSQQDLAGKKVCAKKGSTSITALNKIGARVVPVIKMEEAYNKLEAGKVDAVVFDAPALIYLTEKSDAYADKFEIAGNLFDKQKYGIA